MIQNWFGLKQNSPPPQAEGYLKKENIFYLKSTWPLN